MKNLRPSKTSWKKETVDVTGVLSKIRPGMSIFLTTGVAEPRTLVRGLMSSKSSNLEDLEVVQLVSLGQAIKQGDPYISRFRL
ncbi:MAG: hypothetical protein P8Y00_06910 [Deltaproteobacteria bacterium]